MKYLPTIVAFLALVALTGCLEPSETGPSFSGTGLSISLTAPKETTASTPISILASMKNMASENATGIYAYLTGLEGWNIQNPLQTLSLLQPKDMHTFSWIAYSPSTGNKSYKPKVETFYKMNTVAKLKLRIYDNEYLESLKQSDREAIKSKSALLSFNRSVNMPVSISTSIQQAFVLTSNFQDFYFIVDLKNVGGGLVYNPASNYQLLSVTNMNQTTFTASANYTFSCDVGTQALIYLGDSKSVVCKVTAKRGEIGNYTDVAVELKLAYAYLYSLSSSIKVK